jgi:hypothetical protein
MGHALKEDGLVKRKNLKFLMTINMHLLEQSLIISIFLIAWMLLSLI